MEEARQNKNNSEIQKEDQAFAVKQKWKKKITNFNTGKSEFPFKCYNCGNKGHERANCPKQQDKYNRSKRKKCNYTEQRIDEDETVFLT